MDKEQADRTLPTSQEQEQLVLMWFRRGLEEVQLNRLAAVRQTSLSAMMYPIDTDS
jgi:hypothetical protein